MNNKGFTMIELIMVIMIIALLALLSTPNIIKMINRNKRESYNDTLDSIIEAAELYASDNRYSLNFSDNCNGDSDSGTLNTIIKLSDLIDGKYLSSPAINHCTDEKMDVVIFVRLSCATNEFLDFIVSDAKTYSPITKIEEGRFCDDVYK